MKRLALLVMLLVPTIGPLMAASLACSCALTPPEEPTIRQDEPIRVPAVAKTEAPAWFLTASRSGEEQTVMSRLKATEIDAKRDLRDQLRRSVRDWLVSRGLPSTWTPPDRLIDATVRETHVERVEKDYGTLYQAAARVDFSRDRGARFAEVYESELVGRRLAILAGVLGFVLISLGGLAGYIRADEATKGYYTTNLRLAAAAAVIASGAVIYRLLA